MAKKHGMSHFPEYSTWEQMKNRCNNQNYYLYHRYGGRGIKVCSSWTKFEGFYSDMGPRPDETHSLDRIDPNGNYEPGNCRWATMKVQQRNRTNNRVFTVNGVTAALSELCELHGVDQKTARARLVYGAPIEIALMKGRLPRKTIVGKALENA